GSSSSSRAGGSPAHAADRYHLSFNHHGSAGRVGSRRRVFARLAPHTADLPASGARGAAPPASTAIDDASEDGDTFIDSNAFIDGEVTADQYFDRQMMMLLPPTPPRRRPADSDLDMDSESDMDAGITIRRAAGVPRGGSRIPAGPADTARDLEDEAQVRRALEQFGRLRRQRFLRDQHQWHHASISRDSEPSLSSAARPWAQSRPGTDDLGAFDSTDTSGTTPPLYPSNDVDSYWYNQSEADAAGDSDGGGFQRSSTTHPGTASLRRLGNLPAAPRNPAAEESRSAMLDVLRTHHAFAPSASGSEPTAGRGSREPSWAADEAESGRSEKPETVDNDSEATLGAGSRAAQRQSQRDQQGSARVAERLQRWLVKNSVAVRDLSCALLRPGMRFTGIQRVTPHVRDASRANAFMRLRAPSLEKWDVSVEIQTVDMPRGRVSGLMKAINVPRLPKTVVTCWEGEIIDFVNYTPLTGKWRATCADDSKHWSLFGAVRSHPET
ncbi:hypothetical protein H4S01_005794, partial [Coemansia sp. RSA 2610]